MKRKKIWLPEYMWAYIALESHKRGIPMEFFIFEMIDVKDIRNMSNEDIVLAIRENMQDSKYDGNLFIECEDVVQLVEDEGE